VQATISFSTRATFALVFALALALFFAPSFSQEPHSGTASAPLAGLATCEVIPKGAFQATLRGRLEEPVSPVGENNLFYNLLGLA
jgi:hypothetical protein